MQIQNLEIQMKRENSNRRKKKKLAESIWADSPPLGPYHFCLRSNSPLARATDIRTPRSANSLCARDSARWALTGWVVIFVRSAAESSTNSSSAFRRFRRHERTQQPRALESNGTREIRRESRRSPDYIGSCTRSWVPFPPCRIA
jgi:hypothetical protein